MHSSPQEVSMLEWSGVGRNPDSNPKSKFSLRSFNLGVGRNPDSNPRSEKFHFYGGRRNPDSNPILSSPQEVSIWGRGTGIQTQVQSLSFFYDKFNST